MDSLAPYKTCLLDAILFGTDDRNVKEMKNVKGLMKNKDKYFLL